MKKALIALLALCCCHITLAKEESLKDFAKDIEGGGLVSQ
jgi:hypothetical protein